jgi:hypothetical protein
MALLFIEGFDHLDSSSANAEFVAKWRTATDSNATIITDTPNNKGQAISVTNVKNLDVCDHVANVHIDSGVVGFHYMSPHFWNVTNRNILSLAIENETARHMSIEVNGRTWEIQLNNSTTRYASNFYLEPDVWYYMELKWEQGNPTVANQCQLRVNGLEVISVPAGENFSIGWDLVGLVFNRETTKNYFDNLYVVAASGDGATSFVNEGTELYVQTLFPSGAGSLADWTAVGVANNWDAVDEFPADDDSTYVESNTPGNQDAYQYRKPSGDITTIYGVQLTARAREESSGEFVRMSGLTDISSTQYLGYATDSGTLSTSYQYLCTMFEDNPSTSTNWTVQQIEDNFFGMEKL